MLADNIDFLPKTRLSELREYATKHVINPPAPAPVFSYQSITAPPGISNIEKAECLEALGIIEFYEGNWNQAEQYLHQSLNDYTHEQSRRLPRRLVYVKLLVMLVLFIAYFFYFIPFLNCFSSALHFSVTAMSIKQTQCSKKPSNTQNKPSCLI